MSAIVLGQSVDGGRKVSLDLDILLRTRLLVQSNSGGGKSWLLRRLLEQAFGKVQCIVIDPAGEFSTLREKFGYVLVGHGGETPVDVRSAGLVATKLLELRASAVCDLYSIKPHERHTWVRLFLEATMNAPKKLWHPVLYVVDEAHKFAPEKGEGESEAKPEMLSLVSDGRKYGFCACFATQRLAKLDKSAAAELLNVLIGPTFMDLDLERAHKALGIVHSGWKEFDAKMKTIDPGHFWALGRAISKERLLVKIGPVLTTHPEPGKAGYAATPPPAPDKVKALLPKLADLPRQAEEKARTEAELRTEIRSLRAQVAAAQASVKKAESAGSASAVQKQDPAMAARVRQLERALERAMKLIVEVQVQDAADGLNDRDKAVLKKTIETAVETGTKLLYRSLAEHRRAIDRLKKQAEATLKELRSVVAEDVTVRVDVKRQEPFAVSRPETPPVRPASTNGSPTSSKQKVLDATAWLESVGFSAPTKVQVGLIAGYRVGKKIGGHFGNLLGALRSERLIDYPAAGNVRLTGEGRLLARAPEIEPTTEGLQQAVFAVLTETERRVLAVIIGAYQDPISKQEVGERANFSVGSKVGGHFGNVLGRLRSMGLIDYPSPGMVVASRVLFLEG